MSTRFSFFSAGIKNGHLVALSAQLIVTSPDNTNKLTAFGAVSGGNYNNGSLNNTGNGNWWSATANNTTNRYNLNYNSSNGQFNGNNNNNRYNGNFVRCVRSS